MSNGYNKFDRRDFLKSTAAAGALGTLGAGGLFNQAVAAGDTVHFMAWSAAVDLVKSHVSEFQK